MRERQQITLGIHPSVTRGQYTIVIDGRPRYNGLTFDRTEAAQRIEWLERSCDVTIDPAHPMPTTDVAGPRSTTELTNGDQNTMTSTKKASKKSAENGGNQGRYQLFGFPVTAVLRAMGKKGFSIADAEAAMKGLKIDCARATIQIQVSAGAKGDEKRGEPAKLSAEQWVELNGYKGKGEVKPTTDKSASQTKGRASKPSAKAAAKTQSKGRGSASPKPKRGERRAGKIDMSKLPLPRPSGN